MRKIKSEEILVRVSQVSKDGASLLLYKDARFDRMMLDETYGKNNWQNDFKVLDGKMYGGIGVWIKELNQWVWKWDCGTESNTEAEKGEASDAFKRAGFKWGIGIELYSAPFISVKLETEAREWQGKKNIFKNPYIKFKVSGIWYDDHDEIAALVITDDKGNNMFQWKKPGFTANKENRE